MSAESKDDGRGLRTLPELLDAFSPAVPTPVIAAELDRVGCPAADEAALRVAGLAAQLFLYRTIDSATKAAALRRRNSAIYTDKHPEHTNPTLRVADVEEALRARGIASDKAEYLADSPDMGVHAPTSSVAVDHSVGRR